MSGFRFQLAPVRWSGTLAEILSWNRNSESQTTFRNLQAGNLFGSTYLWQPWFAQVAGNIGFVTGTETVKGGTGIDLQPDSGRDNTLVGGASLSLFPVSRFPFSASFEVTDSRGTGAITTQDFRSTRITLRQDYVPIESPWSFAVGADRSIIENTGIEGRDTVDVFRGSASRKSDRQQLQIIGQHSANQAGGGASEFTFDNLTATYNLRLSDQLNIDSSASFTRSNTLTNTAVGQFENRTSVVDVGSFAYWQPETERPLLVSGNLRYFQFGFDTQDSGENQVRSLSGGANANYSYTDNISLFGNAQVNQVQTETRSDILTLLGAGAAYNSNLISLGKFSYTWNANGNGAIQTGGQEGNQNTAVLSLGQNFFRSLVSDERSDLSMSFGQSLTFSYASQTGNQISLLNSLSGSWSIRQSENALTTFVATASDTHTTGDTDSSFQQLSLQAIGNILFSRNATGSLNISVQSTRQDTPDTPPEGFKTGIVGTASYEHRRAFGVAGLRYTALYTGNTLQLGTRAQGNIDAPTSTVTHALDQRLDYRIGRLDLQGLFRVAQIDGKKNAFIFFRISRDFGAF